MGIELAKALVIVRADIADLKRDLTKAKTVTKRGFKDMTASARRAAQSINTAFTRIGIGSALIVGQSIRKFGQFERTMTRVGGVTDTLGTESFGRLEAAALKMGATTEFTANQSAEAMANLGLAGFQTNQIIAALPGTLQLATAAQVDIATASDIAAKTMRAFGLDASRLSEINDTLVATTNRANTDLRQLAEALKPVGPIAKQMNVSLADTTAILAKMADAGFTGGLGGTSLRNALIAMASPSKEATKVLNAFGVKGADPLFLKLRKLEAGLKAAAGESEQLALATELFGKRGGPAMLAAMDQGVDKIEEFAKGTKALGGVAEKLATAQLNTLAGQFNILKSAIDGVFLSAGKQLNPVFRDLIKSATEWINLNADEITNGIAEAFKGFAEFAVLAWDALKDMGPAFLEAFKLAQKVMRPVFELLKKYPAILAILILSKTAGFLGLGGAVGFAGKAMGRMLLNFGKMISMNLPMIFAGIAIAIGQMAKAAGDATERQEILNRALRGQVEAEKTQAKEVVTGLEDLSDEELAAREKTALARRKSTSQKRATAFNKLRAAKAGASGVGPQVGQVIASVFGSDTREQSAVNIAEPLHKAAKEQADIAEKAFQRIRKELFARRDAAEKKKSDAAAKIMGDSLASAAADAITRTIPLAEKKQAQQKAAKVKDGEQNSLLEAGTTGFAQFGFDIQNALLQQEANDTKKLLANSNAGIKTIDQILAEIKSGGFKHKDFKLQ